VNDIKFRYNERSWAIDLISYINSILDKSKPVQRAGGEYSISIDSQVLFPDVLLFGDSTAGTVLQGWELKMPDTPITDINFIDNATVKARNLGLNSFLLWNATEVNLYVFNTNDDNYMLDNNFGISALPYKSRSDVQSRPEIWKNCAKEIISKLNDYFTTGKIKKINPEIVFSDNGVINQFISCQAEVRLFLQEQARKNKKIDSDIKSWWRYVKMGYPGYNEPYAPLAYCVIMRWFNRFIFTNILYAYNKLPENSILEEPDTSIQKALDTYRQICDKYDYWNILGPADFDELLPENIWCRLVNIFKYMRNFEFSKINKGILHEIIKSTILSSIKKHAGLYATPPFLAELLVRLALNDKNGDAIDPFCGTGTIVKQILEIKSEQNIDGRSTVMTTWGSDKFAFPIQIATLAISSPDIISESLRIFTHDAFLLKPGEDVKFVDPSDGSLKSYKIPVFSSIISNFPFVQFEDIEELNHLVKTKIEEFYKKYDVGENMRLEGRSDLYIYIPFVLYDLLVEGGYIGFIISNSWISTKAGKKFRKLLSFFYHIGYVITSGSDRWFKNTKVVTNLIVCKKRIKNNSVDEITSFITTKIILNDEVDIDEIATDIISSNDQSSNIIISQYNNKNILAIDDLKLSYNYCFGNAKWLIDNIQKFCKLTTYINITRGERRGWDKLFFPNDNAIETIEAKYLCPVLKTVKGEYAYFVKHNKLAFCCSSSLDELLKYGDYGALSWIKKFEHSVNEKWEPLIKVLQRKELYWYQMEPSSFADFVLSVNPDTKIIVQRIMEPVFTNQRLINFTVKNGGLDKELLHALLNSTIVLSQIEAMGFGRGETVLDLNPTNLKNGLYIPRLENISISYQNKIKEYFADIVKEPVMPISDIINSNMRKGFDKLIFESIGVRGDNINYLYDNLQILYDIRKSAKN